MPYTDENTHECHRCGRETMCFTYEHAWSENGLATTWWFCVDCVEELQEEREVERDVVLIEMRSKIDGLKRQLAELQELFLKL